MPVDPILNQMSEAGALDNSVKCFHNRTNLNAPYADILILGADARIAVITWKMLAQMPCGSYRASRRSQNGRIGRAIQYHDRNA